ncbi:probable E3 ubiquitin-protein ligase ARI8 [Tanacetum coccineum]|uniref:Probable E3 ubiquitin-protein ligase ARI8 n=1 Tax=Tanacetum coccineum TaxID=301880 RepID=A0ABQ5E7Y6_9ASTR
MESLHLMAIRLSAITALILITKKECTEEAHRPVDCDIVSKWIMKNSAESENMNCRCIIQCISKQPSKSVKFATCGQNKRSWQNALELERDSGRLLDCIGWIGLPIDRLEDVSMSEAI